MSKIAELLTGEGGLLRVRAVVTFIFVGTVCYLFADGQEVPSELLGLTGVATGFYFGTRGAS